MWAFNLNVCLEIPDQPYVRRSVYKLKFRVEAHLGTEWTLVRDWIPSVCIEEVCSGINMRLTLTNSLPCRLKVKHLCVLLVVLIITLIYFCYYLIQEFPHHHGSVFGLHLPRSRSRLFEKHSDSDEDDENEFMDLERHGKEPEWQVADILRQLPGLKQTMVPVFIVEEHFEVLKYWFDAAATGVIPEKGNTLLHIDGHSDGAPPRDPKIVPWFRLPRNHSEVGNMMQSNDVFIAGSGLTGLINRYIWVWPDWDRAEHVDESDHEINELFAGWRTYYPHNGNPFRGHCVCSRNRADEDWECWDQEPEASMLGGGSVVKSMECSVVFSATMESIHESKALELLKKGELIKPDEKVMLDIDEDYYGCVSSVLPLYKAGLSQKFINDLSSFVNKFLCVEDVHSEFIADKVFRTLVQIVKDFKTSVCMDGHEDKTDCVPEFNADKALIQMIPSISQTLTQAGMNQLLCNGKPGEVMLQIVLRQMLQLNITQLDALNYVGVCLETAPTSMMYEPESLHVCHGFNIPGATSVSFHVPTAEENARRTTLLQNSLSLLPNQPTLVTVCRSIRDGYTPWAFFHYIEQSVIDVLKLVFKDVTSKSFHYDENLMGGKTGWPDRIKH